MEREDCGRFVPNREHLEALVAMGINENQAFEALFCTGNDSVEAAANFIFNNQLREGGDVAGAVSSVFADAPSSEFERLGLGEFDEADVDLSQQPSPVNADPLEAADAQEANPEWDEAGSRNKMVFVVDSSLKMGTGKIASQVAHACLGLYRKLLTRVKSKIALNHWEYDGEKKIVLKAEDGEHMKQLMEKAQLLHVSNYMVQDAGRTQVPEGSCTVLALFGSEDLVDNITAELSLL